MTRKDYELVAKAIAKATKNNKYDNQLIWLERVFGDVLSEDNKAFDRELFIKNIEGAL